VADSATGYPWYQIVNSNLLEQGDILRSFDVLVPSESVENGDDQISAEVKTFDVVVMTQSCDIEQGKTPSLLLCPVFELWGFIERAEKQMENWGRDIREKLRQGNLPGYHLLSDFVQDDESFPLSIVDFHEVYAAPTNLVKTFAANCGPRLRLCPPYKEHLAQAFARFFMRVGLPVGIPREKLQKKS
jgi:hypothetical protein